MLAFVIGFGVKSILTPSNIAVVNLKQVVGQSQKLMFIRKENNIKLNELSKWLDGVEKEINSESIADKDITVVAKWDINKVYIRYNANGATMNNHTCFNASPPIITAGAKLLAGFTDVPVRGIPRICTKVRVRPIIRPAQLDFVESDVTPLIRNTNTKVRITSAKNAPHMPI